jgi:hypothetical protein
MPGLIPMLAVATQLLLVADGVPKLDIEPSCRAAANTRVQGRDADACRRDEQEALNRLREQWGQFSANDRSHCVRLTGAGGGPSYVELLTCLELAKQAAALPPDSKRSSGRNQP